MTGKTVNLNIRTNKALKDSVESILHDLGLTHSTVINLLYRQIFLLKGIPFPVKIPNKTTQKAIKELESKKGLKTYSNSAELFEELGI
jgi:DNA-damage-inducible protein J